jgi:hypothetical protein
MALFFHVVFESGIIHHLAFFDELDFGQLASEMRMDLRGLLRSCCRRGFSDQRMLADWAQ